MHVTIADKLPDSAINELNKLGVEVSNRPELTSSDLEKGLPETDALIVRSTEISRECIKKSPQLMLIVRAGAGVNTIDMDAASEFGIYVANCPGQNSIAVAELTFGLILALDRHIAENVADFRAGKWNKGAYSKADGLFGKVIGVVGVGQIGLEVIRRAKAFGMPVIAWSRSLTHQQADELGVTYAKSVKQVASACDILTVHLALNSDTRGIISKDVLSYLKDGAMVINTARDGVIDEDALYKDVSSGRLRAGLDVFSEEPEYKQGEVKSRFQEVKGVVVTHHIGASTRQAQDAVATDAVDIIRGYLQTGKVRNWLNRSEQTEAPWQLIVRHLDKPGVIANVMNELKQADINAQELENVIFQKKMTACCTIQLDAKPSDEAMQRIRARDEEVISAVLMKNRG
ncbi:MAG: NAD(P)-dependent oxidoreductase [Balneolaceae bacterium]